MSFVKRPSKMAVRNRIRGLTALYQGCDTAPVMEVSVKRGPQPENEAHKEVAAWRNTEPGLLLERNKRRLATPVGMGEPIMLGWLCDGSADWIGYDSMIVTNEMVGQRIAVFVGIETKRPEGRYKVREAQETFLNRAKDAGAIVGVARSREDCELIKRRWKERFK